MMNDQYSDNDKAIIQQDSQAAVEWATYVHGYREGAAAGQERMRTVASDSASTLVDVQGIRKIPIIDMNPPERPT